MKNQTLLILSIIFLIACAPDKSSKTEEKKPEQNAVVEVTDPTKGIGQVKNVNLHSPLEQDRIGRGQAIYEMKCSACHRLDATRVVGPGWKDVTKTRRPEWIMNMITNVDVMLDQDEEAQKLLELCLTRMPNQNVSIGDARDILEFMRQNDGEK
ncbi:MAG: cytochrome c [Chitinophagaceae bacterium]|jgi:mono/diheme cytochrome c family protein|nr:cytochrome c [Chitinophagaceae bacterium]